MRHASCAVAAGVPSTQRSARIASIDGSTDSCKAATSRKRGRGVQPREHLAQLVEPLQLLRRTAAPAGPAAGKRRPGGEVQQVVAMVGAGPLEGAGPPLQFRVGASGSRRSRPPRPRAATSSRRGALSVRRSLLQICLQALDLAQHVAGPAECDPRLPTGEARGPRPAARAACRAGRRRRAAAAPACSTSSSRPLRSTSRCAGQVAAVHRRDVARRQRLERPRVVPVVEVAAVALHAGQRAERLAGCGRAVGRRSSSRSRRRPGSPAAPCRCSSGWCATRRTGPDAPGCCPAAASSLPP